MGRTTKTVPVSKLTFDQTNARLGDVQTDQASTATALANKVGARLVDISSDIVSAGLDPLSSLAVTPEGAPPGKYRVIEGNRRLLALKSLHDPEILINSNFQPSTVKRIRTLADQFAKNPITSIRCVVFDEEAEARHWIVLRHTGANDGVGLVEWDANEKDRYLSRHGAALRNPAGQVIDFVDAHLTSGHIKNPRILTNVQRLINDKQVRQLLGIEIIEKIVHSHYPGDEVIKGLAKIVDDLRSGRKKVADVYHKEDRGTYLNEFGTENRPSTNTRLEEPLPLSSLDVSSPGYSAQANRGSTELAQTGRGSSPDNSTEDSASGSPNDHDTSGSSIPGDPSAKSGNTPPNVAGSQRSRAKPHQDRRTVIPRGCILWITNGRINSIYNELRNLDCIEYTNAASVLLRVFIELSVDHHLTVNGIYSEESTLNTPLAKRLKDLADWLCTEGIVDIQLKRTLTKVADGPGVLGASTVTFHQYVHNSYTFPQANDLRIAWDELQPFMSAIWVK